MKSAVVVLVIALISLSGVAFTMQTLHPSTASAAGIGAGVAHASVLPAQINGLPVTEPVSIVLSSLLLLGATTLLRRNRRGLRRDSSIEVPGNVSE